MNYVVLDFETTGNQHGDEIIEVGMVMVDGNEITGQYHALVKPTVPIPEMITQLTGIKDEDVEDAPPIDEVLTEMLPLLEGRIFVAHHAAFDLQFLQKSLEQEGYAPYDGLVLDTIDLLKMFYPNLASYQLSMVCEAFDIEHHRAHRADSDAMVTAEIFIKMLHKIDSMPLLVLERCAQIVHEPQQQLMDLHHYLLEHIKVKQNHPHEEGHFHYYRQFALAVDDWLDKNDEDELDKQEGLIDEDFKPYYERIESNLQNLFPSYERREAQETMMEKVKESFEEERHLLIEAGTGTGKSLGYLIPALHHALQHEEKVIVSTHTINLQEQLWKRDVPLLQHIFPDPFEAAVLKGRSHYLCLRKFEHKINASDYEKRKDDVLHAAGMVVWLSETMSGDEEELNNSKQSVSFWRSVASDAPSCMNRACPWFSKCFYHRARDAANKSDVVITNHSLLLTDRKTDHRLLPSHEHIIIDEAHQFEEVACKQLGIEVSYYRLFNNLTSLYMDSSKGKLPKLRSTLHDHADENVAELAHKLEPLFHKILEIKEHWEQLTEMLYGTIVSKESVINDNNSVVLRLQPKHLPSCWEEALIAEDNIKLTVTTLVKELDTIIQNIKENDAADDLHGIVTDLNGTVKELTQCQQDLHSFFQMKDSKVVYWIECNGHLRHKSIQLMCIPIDVSDKLKQYFFDVKKSVVMTSATLSVHQKFDYFIEQLGLETAQAEGRLTSVKLESPFDYRNNALVVIPRDIPKLKGAQGSEEFVERLVASLSEVAATTKGKMLVLFTSYHMLKQVHPLLKAQLKDKGIQVLGQGVDSSNRSKLTHQFTQNANAVLLGTSSFWEGVDIPGDALTCLVIVRLPFQPPNHPVVEAKSEYLKQQKKNPFMEYSVPQAVIRFKQGFGRLIRTVHDRGVVIIYDTRVIDTYYGKQFLYSLPGPKIETMATSYMSERIKQWMEEPPKD
ncbi:ATP-dependent DNA helicase DinG [Longirhabdus pacifica]|uniref:ATP-dependent DNA helicase DinG n=1 Tax=Longirhabdus pacifica TaxID=2305227 RepID=UPI001008B7FF|nr:ATP-dependent DNA helicase DinG [Longirhabdus pacifica]